MIGLDAKQALRLVLASVSLLAAGSIWAADFRQASWGMTFDEVLALHPGVLPADRRIRYLTYESKLAQLDVKIFYRFDDEGALYQAGYEVALDEDDSEAALADYEKLNGLLLQRYPEAQPPEQIWRKQVFKDNPDKWARAVRVGHMSYIWRHSIPGTEITHSIGGTRRELAHLLTYQAKADNSDASVLDQL